MPSNISTPEELSSSARPAAGRCWRVVEAQHVISTAKLTDTAAEQRVLEERIEKSKPQIPPECRHLNFLLSTPFRYGAPYPRGSRFRRAGHTLGVFYGAESADTAPGGARRGGVVPGLGAAADRLLLVEMASTTSSATTERSTTVTNRNRHDVSIFEAVGGQEAFVRLAPAPLYSTHHDVWRAAKALVTVAGG